MNTTYSESYHEHDRTSCNDENLNNIDPDGSGCRRCNALLFDQYFSLQKEAQAWKLDAERYRFIRSPISPAEVMMYGVSTGLAATHLDEEIDAAMGYQK